MLDMGFAGHDGRGEAIVAREPGRSLGSPATPAQGVNVRGTAWILKWSAPLTDLIRCAFATLEAGRRLRQGARNAADGEGRAGKSGRRPLRESRPGNIRVEATE